VDSITQILLGASVGEATLGRQVGRRALLWGGICGLFPDLDILVPLGDAVKEVTYHRGPSHSLFVLAVLTPLFVALIVKLHRSTAVYRTRWFALVYLAFATHVLLDCFTVYGTQIFWPIPTPPVMWSTIFIIDPAYSMPLLVGVLGALMIRRQTSRGHVLNAICLVLSTVYLMWTASAKIYVDTIARASLSGQQVAYQRLLTVPAPFNSVLWRVLAVDENGYHEGFYSLLDPKRTIRFSNHTSDPQLLDGIETHWPVQRLQWFTHGFYAVERRVNDIVITDLRMGMEPSYVFAFKVGEAGSRRAAPTPSRRVYSQPRWEKLRWVWQRIWSPEPDLSRVAMERFGRGDSHAGFLMQASTA
jgi:inner membrane protein